MERLRSYHHGDLRRALLDTAAETIAESGPQALSLRELARRIGVSHAAPQHHFGDKAGLLTALAIEGFELLAQEVSTAKGDLLASGVAYVGFAARHRAHFEVMFQPSLYRADDPQLAQAQLKAREALEQAVRGHRKARGKAEDARLAAWSIAHGFAKLWLAGALPPELGRDPEAAARKVLRMLFSQ